MNTFNHCVILNTTFQCISLGLYLIDQRKVHNSEMKGNYIKVVFKDAFSPLSFILLPINAD